VVKVQAKDTVRVLVMVLVRVQVQFMCCVRDVDVCCEVSNINLRFFLEGGLSMAIQSHGTPVREVMPVWRMYTHQQSHIH